LTTESGAGQAEGKGEDMGEKSSSISRRDALKLSAGVAGAAAFATPVVVGAFQAPALGGQPFPTCDPETDSDAVVIESATGNDWNINCESGSTWGRYNSQQSVFGSSIGNVTIQFGELGVDNFDVEDSYYSIIAPAGYECVATWALKDSNGTSTCDGVGETTNTSVPANPTSGGRPTFALPYCKAKVQNGAHQGEDTCDTNLRLEVVSLVCCHT
jgi:hypothetical protein